MRIRVLSCVLMVLVCASAAQAQATRTWVSGVGDDANPCSRTAPCKTFPGAISKTADAGYINVTDPGGFGVVTITKGITIDGYGFHSGILTSSGNGIIVNAPGKTVVLRNLSIEGAGLAASGIRIVAAAKVVIENVTISNFVNNGILVVGAAEVTVNDVTIKNITDQGIYVQAGKTTLNRVSTMGGSIGVLAGTSAIVTANDSVASNHQTGFGAAYSATSQINLNNCTSTTNQYGVLAVSGGTVRIGGSMLVNNTSTAMFNDGTGFLVSFGDNRFAGNALDGTFTSTIALR